ncbi:MAG: PEPxxWA-CTERM sorting domain-containing protein [Alphaproteobacteria bacterium]|nr:PEPxxWA-CTERM sorting domain-containing protein [Alphaproteobacteria bacterium]MBU1513266.1 PEPxxWA-CTERM sorting domain-containing protein [Alphaproteobacteria bacterium]MBU2093614.1 PEPxxWA-CTERM sorting domain-containing protein [Alphaproteobacteria bacterium]MBU2151942.1 PEPxxWA-CTERM sorting domain-containing protein [Alphaproteobacteria bacterium]MBU2307602.1 PEPxxWA-CTERM sorting domain-containing protein [Alphaproteobacteria bacterium]
MKFVATLVGALALASSAQAVTYDAFTAFDGQQGSGGFVYMKMPPVGVIAPPMPLTAPSGACVVTSTFCLQDGGGLPGVYKSSTTFTEGTYTVPNDRLLVHPGASNAIGIFFFAPEAGVYDFEVSFNILDNSPSGIGISSITNASGVGVGTPVGALGANTLSLSRSGSISLAQGQFLAFVVNPAGSYANDSTGVNFTLSRAEVPEPGSWALMILGFAGAGAMLRRRPRLAA